MGVPQRRQTALLGAGREWDRQLRARQPLSRLIGTEPIEVPETDRQEEERKDSESEEAPKEKDNNKNDK